jgi:hypothetical protein
LQKEKNEVSIKANDIKFELSQIEAGKSQMAE